MAIIIIILGVGLLIVLAGMVYNFKTVKYSKLFNSHNEE